MMRDSSPFMAGVRNQQVAARGEGVEPPPNPGLDLGPIATGRTASSTAASTGSSMLREELPHERARIRLPV